MFENCSRIATLSAVLALTVGACFPAPPEEKADTSHSGADIVVEPPPDTVQVDTALDTSVPLTSVPDTSVSDVASCPASCAQPADPCKTAVCDPNQGVCVTRDAEDGATCDDGLFCTVGDRCIGGICLSAQRDCADAADCTIDTCDEIADACSHDGVSCGCGPGVSCDDGNPCNGVESCDLATYTCVNGTPIAENVPCDDGLYCTVDDRCHAGTCAGVARPCGDDLACTTNACDETNQRCVNDPSACVCVDDAGCPNANKCDGTTSCDTEQNTCIPGTPVVCTAPSEACKVAVCVPATGECAVVDADNGTGCDDQSVCTTSDKCIGGTCAGTAIGCVPPNACQQSAGCDPVSGCQFTPKSGQCPVSAGVTGTCAGGTCQPPVCVPACEHGGLCVAPNTCDCSDTDFHGAHCEIPNPCGVLGVPCPPDFVCTDAGTCENETEVFVPAGQFWMGCNPAKETCVSPNESPQHLVTLSGYAIDKNKVTVAEYEGCVNDGTCSPPQIGSSGGCSGTTTYGVGGKLNYPIDGVHADDAEAYCEGDWSGTGVIKVLCTEAQWERAARGGCETVPGGEDSGTCRSGMRTYPWGEAAPSCDLAVLSTCNGGSAPVGSKPGGVSPYGARDMGGNFGEWVATLDSPYTADPVTDPPMDTAFVGSEVVIRGSAPRAARRYAEFWNCAASISFRCCRPVE
ncbi:MAG: hypothetical protein CVU56_05360 [Deltaproteobacteria bacterium HGW-Deltaproteobacteria-14]|nr:MAG: hypothetical protein CVU56_05360 [Deltaproteobacteria bacterium HGW-Deltaproteobacteria-14]